MYLRESFYSFLAIYEHNCTVTGGQRCDVSENFAAIHHLLFFVAQHLVGVSMENGHYSTVTTFQFIPIVLPCTLFIRPFEF